MKQLITSFFAVLILSSVMSCNSKKENRESDEPARPVFVFTDSDSLSIHGLADQYVDYLNAGNFEAAADMLYSVRNDSVLPLSDEVRTGYINAMRHLPNFGFQKKELTLSTDLDNRIRIVMLLTEDGDIESEKGIVNYYLNPVKIDGQWYLTTFDVYAEGVGIYAD